MNLKEQKEKIGEFLMHKRIQKGISYYRIEKLTNMRQPLVQSIEKGTQAYTINSLIKLCDVLDVDLFNLKH